MSFWNIMGNISSPIIKDEKEVFVSFPHQLFRFANF